MPMYEWVHSPKDAPETACRQITSVIHNVSDFEKHPEKCDHCGYSGDEGWRRYIGKTSFVLKGGGWADDGYGY